MIQDIRRDERGSQDPRVFVAYTKNMYAMGQTEQAHQLLRSFCETISIVAGLDNKNTSTFSPALPEALPDLCRIVRQFSVNDLVTLQRQMRRAENDESSHRFMPSGLVQTLTTIGLFCPPLDSQAKQHFASLGLKPIDVNLLLASCHLKVGLVYYHNRICLNLLIPQLSKWSQSLNAISSQIAHQRGLVPDATDAQIATGELLGGWCSVPGILINVFYNLRTAIKCCPEAHKVWRDWAEMNFQLAQSIDQSRGHGRPTGTGVGSGVGATKEGGITRSSQQAASAAATSLEVCPVLSQLEEERHVIYEAWRYAICNCLCHDHHEHRRHNNNDRSSFTSTHRRVGKLPSKLSFLRLKERDQILKSLEHFRRSLTLQLQQHLGFVVSAAGGFVRSIALRPSGHDVQELLRLLTVWFRVSNKFSNPISMICSHSFFLNLFFSASRSR